MVGRSKAERHVDDAPPGGPAGASAYTATVSLRLAHRVAATHAEGPGLRAAVWVRGCTLRCPGCCNPELFEPNGDAEVTEASELDAWLDEASRAHAIEGLSILGGEPLEQIEGVTRLSRTAQRLGLGVILYTGHTLETWRGRAHFEALWDNVDTIVDGPFDARQPERSAARPRRYIGSANQRLWHRSDRYADEALWRAAQRIAEVQIDPRGLVSLHGEPGLSGSVKRRLVGG